MHSQGYTLLPLSRNITIIQDRDTIIYFFIKCMSMSRLRPGSNPLGICDLQLIVSRRNVVIRDLFRLLNDVYSIVRKHLSTAGIQGQLQPPRIWPYSLGCGSLK